MDIDALLKQVGNLTTQVTGLVARVAALEQKGAESLADPVIPTTLQPPADWANEVSKGLEATFTSFTSSIENRLAAIEGAMAAPDMPNTMSAPDLTTIEARLSAIEAAAPIDLTAIEGRLTALETAPKGKK